MRVIKGILKALTNTVIASPSSGGAMANALGIFYKQHVKFLGIKKTSAVVIASLA